MYMAEAFMAAVYGCFGSECGQGRTETRRYSVSTVSSGYGGRPVRYCGVGVGGALSVNHHY